MPQRLLTARIRSCLARRDVRALARSVRAAGPRALAGCWPGLSPIEKIAAFKTLSRRDARSAFLELDGDGRWLAYLAAPRQSVAPLLEKLPRAGRRLLRTPSAAERREMRGILSR